jgi:glycosyltransferase 2 family protein
MVGIAILLLVASFVDVGEALRALRNLHPGWVGASVACFVGTRVLMAAKWWVLLGGRAASVSYATVQRALCLSDYYGMLFPNTLAVDATRVILLRHSRGGASFMTAAVLADRVINVMMTAVVSLLAMGLSYTLEGKLPLSPAIAGVVVGLSLSALVAGTMVASRRVMRIAVRCLQAVIARVPGLAKLQKAVGVVERIHAATSTMLNSRTTLVPAIGMSCLVVLVRVASVYFLFRAIGAPQPVLLALTLVPAITLIALLPISIMGLGLKDGAFVMFFGSAGVATSLALGVSLTSYAVIISGSIFLGILASVFGPPLPTAENETAKLQDWQPKEMELPKDHQP